MATLLVSTGAGATTGTTGTALAPTTALTATAAGLLIHLFPPITQVIHRCLSM